MVSAYKCTALNVSMEANVGDRATVDPLVAASTVCEGAPEQDAWGAVGAMDLRDQAGDRTEDGDEVSADTEVGDDGSDGVDTDARSAASDCVMAYLGDHQVMAQLSAAAGCLLGCRCKW
jgi:hypothetical protein